MAAAPPPANDALERWADGVVAWDGLNYGDWPKLWTHRQVVRAALESRSWEPIEARYQLFRRVESAIATRRRVRRAPVQSAESLARTLERMERAHEILEPRGGCLDALPASLVMRSEVVLERDLRALAIALATVAAIDRNRGLPSEPVGLHDPALADPVTGAPFPWSFDGTTLRVGHRSARERDALATIDLSVHTEAGVAVRFDGVEPGWELWRSM